MRRDLDINLIPMFDCDTRSYLAGVEALDDDAVLVELVLGLHPLRFPLFSGQEKGLWFDIFCNKLCFAGQVGSHKEAFDKTYIFLRHDHRHLVTV